MDMDLRVRQSRVTRVAMLLLLLALTACAPARPSAAPNETIPPIAAIPTATPLTAAETPQPPSSPLSTVTPQPTPPPVPAATVTAIPDLAPTLTVGEEHALVFTVPVGEAGVSYRNVGVAEALDEGPRGLTVDSDGSFWLADAVGERLLHYDAVGNQLNEVTLSDLPGGITDIAADDESILALNPAAMPPLIVRLSDTGTVLATYPLPEGLRPENGLSGIAIGPRGEILVELEGGARRVQLLNPNDELEIVELSEPSTAAAPYIPPRPLPNEPGADLGIIVVGDSRIEVRATRDFIGGLHILGPAPDGGFYVQVDDVQFAPTIEVDQTIRHYSATGDLRGIARVPLMEQFISGTSSLAIGPDGSVYALLTQPDHVAILQLNFAGAAPSP